MKTEASETPQRRARALPFVIICLLVSGVIRVSDPVAALAKDVNASLGDIEESGGIAPALEAESCADPETPGELLAAIRERQEQLDARDVQIRSRMQALAVAEEKIKVNMAALVEAEEKLARTLSIADGAAEKDLAKLTAVYESMKPKNAAGLFSAMAPDFAAGFLARMRPEAAADILSALSAEEAYSISVIMAGRNARAPVK